LFCQKTVVSTFAGIPSILFSGAEPAYTALLRFFVIYDTGSLRF